MAAAERARQGEITEAAKPALAAAASALMAVCRVAGQALKALKCTVHSPALLLEGLMRQRMDFDNKAFVLHRRRSRR